MNYGLVDSLMKEFEQRNSLMIPGDLRRKVNMFVSLVFSCSHPHLVAKRHYHVQVITHGEVLLITTVKKIVLLPF